MPPSPYPLTVPWHSVPFTVVPWSEFPEPSFTNPMLLACTALKVHLSKSCLPASLNLDHPLQAPLEYLPAPHFSRSRQCPLQPGGWPYLPLSYPSDKEPLVVPVTMYTSPLNTLHLRFSTSVRSQGWILVRRRTRRIRVAQGMRQHEA